MKTKTIISKARDCKKNVEKLQKLGVSDDMAYYSAKVILKLLLMPCDTIQRLSLRRYIAFDFVLRQVNALRCRSTDQKQCRLRCCCQK